MTHTRKMAYIAILSAISFLLMYLQFQILPGVDFLKLDFSILPILIALVVVGEKSAYAVLLIRSLLQLVLNNQGASTLIGMPMNAVAYGLFVFAFARFWKANPQLKNYLVASLAGIALMVFSMTFLNAVYALPLYARFANFNLAAFGLTTADYLLTMVVPFNLIQGVILAVAFYLVYRALAPIFRKL